MGLCGDRLKYAKATVTMTAVLHGGGFYPRTEIDWKGFDIDLKKVVVDQNY
jgi:hypothetical protein